MFSCHASIHDGLLLVTGRAPDNLLTTRVADVDALVRVPRHAIRTVKPACLTVEAVPAEQAPVEQAAVEQAVVEHAPLEHAPLEHVPVSHAPLEHAPAEHVPVAHAQVAHAPVAHAPVAHPIVRVSVDRVPMTRKLDEAIMVTQARDALVALGWKPAIARAAVDEARAHVGAALEDLIREALRRCPIPSTR
jgi:Holliday junction resolvase RuvA-like protein